MNAFVSTGRAGIVGAALILGAAVRAESTLPKAPVAATTRPNILLLMADEFRFDALGAVNSAVKTPALDQLAREGVRFSSAYAASPICGPSRACFFTGHYPQVNGVTWNELPLNPGERLLPELLTRAGYSTAIIGKWHLPRAEVFDYRVLSGEVGPDKVRMPAPAYLELLREKMPALNGSHYTAALPGTRIEPPLPRANIDRTVFTIGTSVLPDDLYEESWLADRAIDFLRSRRGARQPWFAVVSLLKPHSPFVIPAPWATMYAPDKVALPPTFVPDAAAGPIDLQPGGWWSRGSFIRINDPRLLREIIAHYEGAVSMVDHHFGRVLAELTRLGFANNTIVVFTSDHGSELGEHNLMFKDYMYEGSVRIPFILRVPGMPGGRVVNNVFDATALAPTLLDFAGVPRRPDMSGPSLRSLLAGAANSAPDEAFSALPPRRMFRRGPWKLLLPLPPPPTRGERAASAKMPRSFETGLYNLERDPFEQHNLYGDPEVEAIQQEMTKALETRWRSPPVAAR